MHRSVHSIGFSLLLLTNAAAAGELDYASPRDAGARYAQALGAAETCGNLVVTEKAKALKGLFHAKDLDEFNSSAASVYASWQKVKSCSLPQDPNPCRIMIQLSCQSAVSEIGPEGSAATGLLDVTPP